ncbi:amphi-Trp domain-containing protein [uncultured Desulfobacter sp.]|jgi:amphi-Trp domain-containing protein|uniref:amphi-Trp domain-containing protein n=1 Tax=uncultured Desulfobacter sp. TaxID=240139 RepID=UPI0029C8601F|nr:amphi-Trp domain-containing protein [uncultured Desulfobacter sp.]
MGKEKVLLKSEEKMSKLEAAKLLRDIAEKIEKGKVTLRKGKDETVLDIPERVEVEIKAEEEVGKRKIERKLEIEIEWKVGDHKGAGGQLVIK